MIFQIHFAKVIHTLVSMRILWEKIKEKEKTTLLPQLYRPFHPLFRLW